MVAQLLFQYRYYISAFTEVVSDYLIECLVKLLINRLLSRKLLGKTRCCDRKGKKNKQDAATHLASSEKKDRAHEDYGLDDCVVGFTISEREYHLTPA